MPQDIQPEYKRLSYGICTVTSIVFEGCTHKASCRPGYTVNQLLGRKVFESIRLDFAEALNGSQFAKKNSTARHSLVSYWPHCSPLCPVDRVIPCPCSLNRKVISMDIERSIEESLLELLIGVNGELVDTHLECVGGV